MNEKQTIEIILQKRNCNSCGSIGFLVERKDIPIKYIFECKKCGFLNEFKIELEDKKDTILK